MKKLILLPLFIWSCTVFAQWHPLNGPEGSTFYCLIKTPYGIFCGTTSNLYKSVNEGMTWQRVNSAPEKKYIDILDIHDTLVALYDDYSMYNVNSGTWSIISYDHGSTWTTPPPASFYTSQKIGAE